MRFSVRHQTIYRYSAPVRLAAHVLRFNPRPDAGALIERALIVEPEPVKWEDRLDRFGNLTTRVEFAGTSDLFRIDSRFAVEVASAPAVPLNGRPSLPWLTDFRDPNSIYVEAEDADGAVRAFARRLAVEAAAIRSPSSTGSTPGSIATFGTTSGPTARRGRPRRRWRSATAPAAT